MASALTLGVALALAMSTAACQKEKAAAPKPNPEPAAETGGIGEISTLPGATDETPGAPNSPGGSNAANAANKQATTPSTRNVAMQALVRYGGTGFHWVTTGQVDTAALYPEYGGVWYVAMRSQPGTRALYGCRNRDNAKDHFLSLRRDCEGHSYLGGEGWIYTSKPTGAETVALYRCNVLKVGDHYVTPHSDCEKAGGARNEGLLGYALTTSKVTFSRFKNASDHWSTSGAVGTDYRAEGRVFLEGSAKPGTVALYGCTTPGKQGEDHFVSLRSDCEGRTKLRTEGWVYTSKPSGQYTPLYRCRWDAPQDHFVSLRSDCEKQPGAVSEGLLGYASLV